MNVKKTLLLAACLASAGLVVAEPSTNVAWTVETYRMVRHGDPEIGAKLEGVETEDVNACTDCHGKGGAEPDRDKHPTLAGQNAAYVFKQLRDYKDGKRENRRMEEAVERLSDEQLTSLAAWYAMQPLPKVETDPDDKVSPETLELVFRGDKKRLIQPCASCHGENGQGAKIDVPSIAGQNVKYFVETMKDYAKDKRTNDVYSRMRIIAKELTRDEVNELAVYYARLPEQPRSSNLLQALFD
ncbi:MAG: cytochrome c4 [Gammaproteobacteria bacterium]|nr:cytochrome c4 [Gammaproteobacteria bacterium]MCP5299202.1 cytochrome c4 [Chromatiaceae bacterium]